MSDVTGFAAFRAFLEEVRGRVELVEVVRRDVELRRVGQVLKGLSPFHAEKHPSFVVWPETQTWRDYSNGGGSGGDIFAYVQEREKISFKDAVLLLAERAGVRPPNQDSESWKRMLALRAERLDVERLLTMAATYYHQHTPEAIRDKYLKQHYGFDDKTIVDLQLGWADGHLFDHLTKAGVSRPAALATGLFVPLDTGRVVDFFRHRLVFPYWSGGRVVYFTARATEETGDAPWEQAKYKKLRIHSEKYPYISVTVRNDYFYNEDAARSDDELVITEGVPDCISARQCNVACISPGTTSLREQDLPRLLELTRHAKRVVICNDAEASGAGEHSARSMAAQLWDHGREVCIAVLPRPPDLDKLDLNELVAAHGPPALRSVLDDARPYPEFLLDEIPGTAARNELDKLLEPLLTSLGKCSAIRADVVLDAITAKFGLRRRALTLAMKRLVPDEPRRPATSSPERLASPIQAATPPAALPSPDTAVVPVRGITADAGRPQICVTNRQLRDVIGDAWNAAHAANRPPRLFTRAGALVRLVQLAEGPRIDAMNEAEAYGYLARVADWVKETEIAALNTYPPRDVARDMLAYPDPSLPVLEAVVSTPVFVRDGTLVSMPGYHEGGRLWYEPPPAMSVPPVPPQPSPAEVAAARTLLLDDLLGDFPFVDDACRANMVAALLLPFARRLIPGATPIHLFEAPTEGSGKGLLVNLVAMLATGRRATGGSIPENEDELRKKLGSELSSGRPLLVLDNADNKRPLDSSALASATTMWPTWTDRLLGQIKMFSVPNEVVWLLTGNNPRLSRELARRCVSVRLDPGTDRPWLRTRFRHTNLLDWVTAERAHLIHAAVVLIQNWIAQGSPPGPVNLGTFERWAQAMGGILTAAGITGFLGNLETLYATADAEGTMWREFVAAWWEAHEHRAMRVSELVELCNAGEFMTPVLGDGNERSQGTRLGKALQNARDRVFGNCRIERAGRDSRSKRPTYRLIYTQQGDLYDEAIQDVASESDVNNYIDDGDDEDT